jgi:peptide/nickel transport system permease protein
VLGVACGAIAALRKDGWFDHVTSVGALAVTALPEFVVAIVLVILFSTVVLHVLPAVSIVPPGSHPWDQPESLILPVATLVIVIVPYILRMMRAAMIEALESEYVEMARLKGLSTSRVVIVHAMPNAIAPTIQVIGLNFLYLAGGIVIVEYVFNYPGVGQGLVDAVSVRDIPVIQFIVLVLAAFYVFMNIATDVIALLATPRRRLAR